MKTIAEQIRDLEATRAAKAARMTEVVQKSLDEGRSTDEAEQEEFDNLDAEIKQIDGDLVRLKRLESLAVQKGRTIEAPAQGASPAKSGSEQRGSSGPTIIMRSGDADDKFPGQSFTRIAIAKALAHMEGIGGRTPAEIAKHRWGKTNPTLVQVIKAGVAGGGTDSGEWGAELAQANTRYTGDFVEYLYGMTLFDKLPLKTAPANVVIKGQDGASTAFWVGQSKAIPATTADFTSFELNDLEVGAIASVSKKLVRQSSPSAEMLVRDSLVNASAQRIDTTFLSTAAAVSGVSPAGLLNGVAGHNTHGPGVEGVIADVKQLYAIFQSYKNASNLGFVTTPELAKALSLMLTSLGTRQFPEMTGNGGSLLGDPVWVGDNVPSGAFILMKPSDIYRIEDSGSGVQVSISDVATIEQDSDPQGAADTPTAASATLISAFQTESILFKVVRNVNYAKRRSHAVQYIDNADYGATDTST